MKNNKLIRVSTITFVAGIICMALAATLPYNVFESILGSNRIGGVLTLAVCPVLGLIGLVTAICNKKFMLALGNIIVILAFPIMWATVDLLNVLEKIIT